MTINKFHISNLLFQRFKRQAFQHIWGVRIVLLLVFISIIAILGSVFARPVGNIAVRLLKGPQLVSTFFTDPLYILPSYNGRSNILFLGMGGENHEGAQLTDTMIFVSLDLKNTNVTMLSIPRDIWVPSLQAKINSAFMIGENRSAGGGYLIVEDAVYEIIDQPIHYVVSLDFNGFVNLIDMLGGVDVKVDKEFIDRKYPIAGKENDSCDGDPEYGCRYETVIFHSGLQHMDGITTLKYTRSRHAEGDEGTDFARSIRQQKVITAVKNKLVSSKVFLNPGMLLELKRLASRYVHLDKTLSDTEYAAFAGFGMSFWRSGRDIKTLSLETGDSDNPGFLVNPPLTKFNQWVLEPRDGTWMTFQDYFRQKMDED